MKRYLILFLALIVVYSSCVKKKEDVKRPKIVIGLVIDQMRWDYLYRYYQQYGEGGFKRLMREGYNCQNTMVNYLPANTAPGHTCIYTGSVPSIHGIAGNNWIDDTGRNWYCVEDEGPETYPLVIGKEGAMPMSPQTMHVTTITDELRLATNFNSRVFGVAIKDRGSILPAGHLGNAAYFYNDTFGVFTTTKYYNEKYRNPAWLQAFNKRKVADSLAKQSWKLFSNNEQDYERNSVVTGSYGKGFPNEVPIPKLPYLHQIDTTDTASMRTVLKTMPAGNTFTLMMAKECIQGEKLGMGDATDFLAVSISSTDYVGHQFAPNSKEMQDMFLHLDAEIADFLSYLDKQYGKDNYLLFLTADHGAAHNAVLLQDNNVPAGFVNYSANEQVELNNMIKERFYPRDELGKNARAGYKTNADTTYRIVNIQNYEVFLNNKLIENLGVDRDKIKSMIIAYLKKEKNISYVMDMEDMDKTPVPEPIRTMAINGYNRQRSGCIYFIFDPGWYDYNKPTGTTHGSWNPYDTHIPLLWYGWHISKGETHDVVNMTDISATLASLLHIQMPNGCIGKPIKEVVDGSKSEQR